MSDELKAELERVRNYRMTPEEKRNQEIDFAFGNVHYENARITREMVAESLSSSTAIQLYSARFQMSQSCRVGTAHRPMPQRPKMVGGAHPTKAHSPPATKPGQSGLGW